MESRHGRLPSPAGGFLLVFLLMVGGPARVRADRNSDPYGWQPYTQQLRQEESRRIDRMLDNTYGPNPRDNPVNLQPLANSLHGIFSSLAEARRQRQEEKEVRARYLMELYRLQQQRAADEARLAAENQRRAQVERWAREWEELKAAARAGDGKAAADVARLVRYRSPRLPDGTALGEAAAIPWLRLAAENGHAASAYDLGNLLRASQPAEALHHFTRAAEAGYLDAIPPAADLADEGGVGLPPNRNEALRLLKLGLSQGHRASFVTAARFACLDPTATEVSFRQAVRWLEAAGPDPAADGLLAQVLYHGRPGVDVDVARSVLLAERALAARPSHVGAKEVLGLALVDRRGESDRSRGLRLLHEAGEAGSLAACRRLAAAYQHGTLGVQRSEMESVRWLERGAAGQDASCALALARIHRGRGKPEEAEHRYQEASRLGNAEAALELAVLLDRGRDGFPRKSEESHRLARMAAAAGRLEAMELCGWQSLQGRGCMTNVTEAARWMQLAAEGGLPSAQHVYGLLRFEGTGTERDPAAALSWELRAAHQGHAEAAAQVAYQLVTGAGCSPDPVQAREWARKSATGGSTAGAVTYGLMLARGDGGPMNMGEAVPWLERAHAAGDHQASLELGLLCRDGRAGLDRSRARGLLEAAAGSPDPRIAGDARKAIKDLRQPVPPGSLESLKIHPARGSGPVPAKD